jgi:hypothetical protein
MICDRKAGIDNRQLAIDNLKPLASDKPGYPAVDSYASDLRLPIADCRLSILDCRCR